MSQSQTLTPVHVSKPISYGWNLELQMTPTGCSNIISSKANIPKAGENETDIIEDGSHNVRKHAKENITIGIVLSNSQLIRLFVAHLAREFCMEQLLSLIEVCTLCLMHAFEFVTLL